MRLITVAGNGADKLPAVDSILLRDVAVKRGLLRGGNTSQQYDCKKCAAGKSHYFLPPLVSAYFFAASSHLNGRMSGTTLTSVVNLNGYFPRPLYVSSTKNAVKPFSGFGTRPMYVPSFSGAS